MRSGTATAPQYLQQVDANCHCRFRHQSISVQLPASADSVTPELSMGPFFVTQPNPTNQLTDPTQPTTSEKNLDPTRPNAVLTVIG